MNHSVRWTVQKLAQRLGLVVALVQRRRSELAPFRCAWLEGPRSPAPVGREIDESGWPIIAPNSYWGVWLKDFVLRTSFSVPADWDNTQPLALFLPLGEAGDFLHPEALIYLDGVAHAASDREHQSVDLPATLHDGAAHLLALHGWTGGVGNHSTRKTQLFMEPCYLVQIDAPTRDFVATARVALGTINTLPETDPARAHLLNALDAAFMQLDLREPHGDAFYASVPAAHALLRAGIAHSGPALDVTLYATGHAHIDVAWLWPLDQTRRKASRTFHTVLHLMEQFPDYHFTQSQPQLYEFMREEHPELLERIKARVAEGRWELTGDMWVEADCNLSGAESLARQFLLGRSFFRQHFAGTASSPVLWLPDVFGYAWALPQLIKEAGLEYFFTIKIGWSQYNRLPYDSFWWQGLDGTRVLTHFSPTPQDGSAYASTYNAEARPKDVIGSWTNYRQKDLTASATAPTAPLLMAFGFGDGGGGPTREMLENVRELADFPSAPKVKQAHVGEFFRTLEATAGDALPTWNGELYLEYHRGTYTTQSRNKRANRKSEFLLHDAELAATLASLHAPGYRYPQEAFSQAWRLICLNQFHDIIPGSSINQVYLDSQQQYDQIRELGETARDSALAALAEVLGGEYVVLNPISFARSDLAFIPGELPQDTVITRDGAPLPTQPTLGGTLVAIGQLASFACTTLDFAPLYQEIKKEKKKDKRKKHKDAETVNANLPVETELTASETHLENALLLVELNPAGDITRVYDKVNRREVLPTGAIANQFQAFEDRPMYWDAWDVDIFYSDKQFLAAPASQVRVVESGPLRVTIEIDRVILNSPFIQRISLTANSPRLDIETIIDWRERHMLLKVAFPVDILAPQATYEIQWGNVQRPTHRNTSWDWARFETCAQKWVDLSEGGYGVSLLNDCKHGHDIQANVMRISLLRSPTDPDPEADQGQHRFMYSLLPHAGDWAAAIPEAYALNDPLVVYQVDDRRRTMDDGQQESDSVIADGGRRTMDDGHQVASPAVVHRLSSAVACDSANVIIETLKRAEDGNGIIVRLYESQRRRGQVRLKAGFALTAAYRANLLEENQQALEIVDGAIQLNLRPYEIATLRLIAVV